MNIYLISTGNMLYVEEAKDIEHLWFKYPDSIQLIVKIDDDLLNEFVKLAKKREI